MSKKIIYREQDVIDILSAIYDSFNLKDTYEDKVLEENLVHYDDVDKIGEKAFELFTEDFLTEGEAVT